MDQRCKREKILKNFFNCRDLTGFLVCVLIFRPRFTVNPFIIAFILLLNKCDDYRMRKQEALQNGLQLHLHLRRQCTIGF